MKSKYFSPWAIGLHFAVIVWIALCVTAAWWQVGRAIQGNGLSYMYSIEWPAFALLGVLGWYALLNQEKATEHEEQARRDYQDKMRAQALVARNASSEPEDPTLAAYNDHLAEISTEPKKRLWGH